MCGGGAGGAFAGASKDGISKESIDLGFRLSIWDSAHEAHTPWMKVNLGHAASVGKVVVQLPTGLCSCWMKSARLELLDLADVVLQSHMLEADCLLNQMVVHPHDGADFCLGKLSQDTYSVEPFIEGVYSVQLVLLETQSWQRPLAVAELSVYAFECSGGGKQSSFVAEMQNVHSLSASPSGLYATTQLGDLLQLRVGELQLACRDVWHRLDSEMLQWDASGDTQTFVSNVTIAATGDVSPSEWQFEMQKEQRSGKGAVTTRMLVCAHQIHAIHAAPRRCCEKQTVQQGGADGNMDLDLETARSELLIG